MSSGLLHASPSGTTWEAIIGLEVHVQLKTRTKLFCGCRNAFGEPPNTLTCPVCTGQPGALPVLNGRAVELALRVAHALGCEIAAWSKFDRKNYFYPDLPKGYQISQYDRPFCRGGGLRLSSGRFVRLARIHMEEDAGKTIHDRGEGTLVDLNRAGVPLIEAVTEADLRSSDEASEYLTGLKEILQYVGASDCDMEKGTLRCDVNVSVHPVDDPWRTKVELKNLNSFRNVQAAIEHEIRRQIDAYESGDPARFPRQETRLFDPATGETRTMRTKEDEDDYRYFPEPDLPPVLATEALLAKCRSAVPELPAARRARYREELGLSEYDAGVMTSSRDVAELFEETAKLSGDPKDAANWISNDVLRALADGDVPGQSVADLRIDASSLAELLKLVATGKVNRNAGRKVLRHMLLEGKAPAELVRELGLEQVDDASQLEAWCREALQGQDKIVADVKAGKTKALGALIGPVMKASRGKANPKSVQEILERLVAELP